MAVLGQEVFRRRVQVGEVTTPAAGHQDLLAGLVGALQDQDTTPATGRRDGAHQAGGAATDENHIEIRHSLR